VSIGDVSCRRLKADDLNELEQVWIVENIEDKVHKANCERSFTLQSQHYNCVITINMGNKEKEKSN
jgi:hypothetical protein